MQDFVAMYMYILLHLVIQNIKDLCRLYDDKRRGMGEPVTEEALIWQANEKCYIPVVVKGVTATRIDKISDYISVLLCITSYTFTSVRI